MIEELNKRVEKELKMPAEQLKGVLPSTLGEIRKYGIGKLMEEAPDLLSKIMGKLREIDVTRFAKETPETMDKLMETFWEGVGILAEKSKESRMELKRAREIAVNLEATDSPLKTHFKVKEGKLLGASGLVNFKDQDARFWGSTKELLAVLIGEANARETLRNQGFPELVSLANSILQAVSKLLKAK